MTNINVFSSCCRERPIKIVERKVEGRGDGPVARGYSTAQLVGSQVDRGRRMGAVNGNRTAEGIVREIAVYKGQKS